MFNINYFILILLTLISVFFLSRNIFTLLFSMDIYNVRKKRVRQLQFEKKKSDEEEIKKLIDNVTSPVIKYLFPKINFKFDEEKIAYKLKLSGWNKYFTPIQYIALINTLRVIGVILFLILSRVSFIFALIWFVALAVLPDFLLNNTINQKKEQLISEFPDFIRIIQGYLISGMPFINAVQECIKYVGDSWKPILQQFVIECETRGINEALDSLKENVDIFEVREFVALVKLSLEQGGDIKNSFEAQAEKIKEMQTINMEIKIGKRQTIALLVQGPILLCNILVFGLPTITSMINMQSM